MRCIGFPGLALCLAITTTGLDAQLVRGVIVGDASNVRLSGVQVALVDDRGRENAIASTDTVGSFIVRTPRAGSYRLRATLAGYVPFTSGRIDLAARETVDVALRLATQAIPLAALVVVARQRGTSRLAEFEKRRARHDGGFFVTEEAIERRPIATTTTLLFGAPGITLERLSADRHLVYLPGGLYGPCLANVYIDGALVTQNPSTSIDDMIFPSSLAGIEVYPRAALAPLEYQRAGSCGVVLFWSREAQRGSSWSWIKFAVAGGVLLLGFAVSR